MTSDLFEHFLAIDGGDRPARLLSSPEFPHPLKAEIDGDGFLRWRYYSEEGRKRAPELKKIPHDLCFRFARLARGSDDEIRSFAEQWGPLGIALRAEESVDNWRHYAALANALLGFAAETATGAQSGEEAWVTIRDAICSWIPAGERERFRPEIHERMAIAASVLNGWFSMAARGHQILGVTGGRFQIRLSANNLLGGLATQIAHAMSRSDQLARCAGCNSAFRPKRLITHGSRQYCTKCRRTKVPQRDASRDWRRRRR